MSSVRISYYSMSDVQGISYYSMSDVQTVSY